MYFSSVPIFISNNLLIVLFKKLGWSLVLVDTITYSLAQWGSLVFGIGIAVSAAMKFINNDVLLSLIKKERIVISRDEFQKVLNQEQKFLEK
ncbi:hypothetical protein [Acinetobacter ursingii]|uniref:hypothetical protein n=1 Tax=Acinetobacter ursingii TaxID=108980 RepID=UPI0035565A48